MFAGASTSRGEQLAIAVKNNDIEKMGRFLDAETANSAYIRDGEDTLMPVVVWASRSASGLPVLEKLIGAGARVYSRVIVGQITGLRHCTMRQKMG
jgi:hypothetical protein